MDLLKTGMEFGRALRNAGRLREIVTVFGKNGFDEFLTRGITSHIPNFALPRTTLKLKEELKKQDRQSWPKIVGHRLRLCFEELGPTFVKFGQLLSTREDMFDSAFIEEMGLLRDKVKGIDFENAKKVIESELGKPIDQVFSEFEENPIGQASIGVVYKGKLKSGEDVVIKVQRPGIDKIIETDLSILLYLTSQVEKVSDVIRYLGISRMVYDFAVSMQTELNFHIEAANCERLTANLKKYDGHEVFYLPKIYRDYSTEKVLVQEFLKGIPFSSPKEVQATGNLLSEKMGQGVRLFIKTFLQDGFFHADLHGGNFFLLDSGEIGLIDFGLMGHLTRKDRLNFLSMVYSMVTFNCENLVYEFLEVADYEVIPDIDELIRDVREVITPYMSLTVQQANFSKVMPTVINALAKHQIFLPREWYVVFRALMTLDGVGKSIGYDFDLFELLHDDMKDILKSSYNKDVLIEEALWTSRDLLSLFKFLPRNIRWFTKSLSRDNFTFKLRHSGHEKQISELSSAIVNLGYLFLVGVFVIAGVLMINSKLIFSWYGISVFTYLAWFLATILFMKVMVLKRLF